MTHHVEVNFRQNLQSSRSSTIEISNARNKCYQFQLKSEVPRLPDLVKLEQDRIISVSWLYGPATDLKTRKIIYPCRRYRCSIPCPCLLCAKRHPTCRVPSSKPCNCQDCMKQFDDHQSFHCTFHYGCKYCFQLVQIIPSFNFFFMDVEKKVFPSGCYDSNTTNVTPNFIMPESKVSIDFLMRWRRKMDKWLSGKEDPEDMWCKNCNVLFWSFEELRQHIKTKHMVSKIFTHHCRNTAAERNSETKCYQCSKNFASIKELHLHIEVVHFQDSHACGVCGATFTREANLVRHRVMKHEGRSEDLICKECGKQVTMSDILKRHSSVVHSKSDRNRFHCDICLTVFNREANLTRHVENRFQKDGSFKHPCDVCDKNFCTNAMLLDHSKSNHSEMNEEFLCAFCSKSFSNSTELKEHVTVHDDKVFKCFSCSQTFTKAGNLRNHIKRKHENKTLEFICSMCNTNFKTKFCLERHQKEIYIGSCPQHSCQECNEVFCTSKLLRAHTNLLHSHHGCDLCKHIFNKKSNLNLHMKKRMCCNTCGNLFCNHLLLKHHMKKDHVL